MARPRDLELVLRIVVGTAPGGVIGYERDIHGRPAGLRTHAVVALASATFMVVSTHRACYQHRGSSACSSIRREPAQTSTAAYTAAAHMCRGWVSRVV